MAPTKSPILERVRKGKKRPGSTLGQGTQRSRDTYASRRKGGQVVVTGVGPRQPIKVTKRMYAQLDFDPAYQRDIIPREVNDLLRALMAGGLIPDPVTLVRRKWADDGKLWVVDGLQRATALMQLDREFEADVHEVDSIEAERNLFLVFNSRVAVSATRIVHTWPGSCAAMLRSVDVLENHPLFGRVGFGTGPTRISSAILIKGMVAVAGIKPSGGISRLMSRLDFEMEGQRGLKPRLAAYLRLIGMIFPQGWAHSPVVVAIGEACQERWKGSAEPALPRQSVISRLARANWAGIAPTGAQKFRPLIVEKVKSVWKEEA